MKTITILDLDRLVNAYDFTKEFGRLTGSELFSVVSHQLPTTALSCLVPTYNRAGSYTLINRPRYKHIRLISIYEMAEERIANKHRDLKINVDMWVRLREYVKKDMLETYTILRRENGA